MDLEQITSEDVLAHLTVADLIKLKEILALGVHELTPQQVNTLKSLIGLYAEYATELKVLVEEKKVSVMWTKIRLQTLLTLKYVLYFVLGLFAAIQSFDVAYGIVRKWWAS
jgi:hypothetical protein